MILVTDGGIAEVERKVDAELLEQRVQDLLSLSEYRVMCERLIVTPNASYAVIAEMLDTTVTRVRALEASAVAKLKAAGLEDWLRS